MKLENVEIVVVSGKRDCGYCVVHADLNGKEEIERNVVFGFYSDEINFTENELEGLTLDQALELRHKRDVAYIQG